MADETKELIASSEFDPSNFVRGIDQIVAALEKLSKQEDEIRATMRNIDAALKSNRQEYKTTTTDIQNLEKGLKKNAVKPELINTIFRQFHSLKGISGMVGFERISTFTHELESTLDRLRLGKLELTES